MLPLSMSNGWTWPSSGCLAEQDDASVQIVIGQRYEAVRGLEAN